MSTLEIVLAGMGGVLGLALVAYVVTYAASSGHFAAKFDYTRKILNRLHSRGKDDREDTNDEHR